MRAMRNVGGWSASIALIAAFLTAAPCAVLAQHWPTRPVTMVVPFPAGGPTDVLARYIARHLSEELGQQFVVDNRGGAGGNIGAAAVARAKPDGYTIMFGTPGPLALNVLMYKNLAFDPQRAFAPVVLVGKSPLVIVANQTTSIEDFRSLAALATHQPGKVTVGHPGNGTLGHIAAELLQRRLGATMTSVPYRGSAPLLTDLLSKQVEHRHRLHINLCIVDWRRNTQGNRGDEPRALFAAS